jgi:hypothetical protein
MATTPVKALDVPVSRERVEVCLKSATFWVNELPRYADRQQGLADSWAIAAGVLASITSLSIFPILGDDSSTAAKGIVSAVALLAAICALVPRVKNYAELAGQARELTSRYGGVVGDLIDLAYARPFDQERARDVVTEFQTIKEKKDALRGLPDRAKIDLRSTGMAEKVALARTRAAEAEKAEAEARQAADVAKNAVGGP